MMLRNTTRGDLSAGGVTFPAGGVAEAPPAGAVRGDAVFAAWLAEGRLVEAETVVAPAADTDQRAAVIRAVIGRLPLGEDAYTTTGKPDVHAINAALPEDMARVTAAERDAVWREMQEG